MEREDGGRKSRLHAERYEHKRLSRMSQECCVTGRGEGMEASRVSLAPPPPWHDTNPEGERRGKEV